ncbi:MAG: proline iminopeptidase, partial [Alphaproteobacteria bacterium]|nr:proline iminopeptidase [Alphaproteobacteria bacterium]
MWQERKWDAQVDFTIDGYTVKTYSFGSGDEVVLLLNGGPGIPCDYL